MRIGDFITKICYHESRNITGDYKEAAMTDMKIIADSSCDISPEEKERLEVALVPLTLTLGEQEFVDDDALDLPDFMARMKAYQGKVSSACPSPGAFQEAFQAAGSSICITISEKLSGTYQSALLGKELAEKEGARAEVVDSKSASAGEVLLVYKIREWMEESLPYQEIAERARAFADTMKTYFVLDSVENLVKNGRMNKVVGTLVQVLGVKPIMGADGEGNIALFGHARGRRQILEKMAGLVKESGKETEGELLVIAHNNNWPLARELEGLIRGAYRFRDVLVVQTRGISSMYANDKGLVMAF